MYPQDNLGYGFGAPFCDPYDAGDIPIDSEDVLLDESYMENSPSIYMNGGINPEEFNSRMNPGQISPYGIYGSDLRYSCPAQLELDPQSLLGLGFSQAYIDLLNEMIMYMGKVTQARLMRAGLNQNDAYILKYMYDICTGRVRIENSDELSKHLRKLFGRVRRIGIQDLMASRLSDIPRVAVVAGIPDGPFAIYNSNRYSVMERIYKVISVSGTTITIESSRLPVLKYKEPRFIEGIIEIKEKTKKNTVILAVNRKHCRLCNRFIVVASLKRPEFHHGMVEIICIEGTRIYVYAMTASKSERLSYNSQTQRIYSFGYFPFEIAEKLNQSATAVYQKLCGVYSEVYPANSDYTVIMQEKVVEPDSDEEDDLGIVD